MPFASVRLVAGVNTERTPTLNEAGISTSQLIRFKDALVQKMGGWEKFYQFSVAGTPRDMHAWEDLNNNDHLAIGATSQLAIITDGSLLDVTPQTFSTSFSPNFSTSPSSAVVSVTDANLSAQVTPYDAIYFNTPVAVGGLILSGLYPIDIANGTTTYKITAATTAISTASGTGVVPRFDITSGDATVDVVLPDHGLSAGGTINFPIPTTFGNITIDGVYEANSITNSSTFVITIGLQAATSTTFLMNNGSASLTYYITLGPSAAGGGYGGGGYGSGGYGTGVTPDTITGNPITATDWTTDNWGEILIACPMGGAVYAYNPLGGFQNAGLVTSAPLFNGGIFVSTSQQILVCWGSTATLDIGLQQDPMLVRWSTIGDYTDFAASSEDTAGSFRIPIGSKIMAGMAVSNQNLIWTDLDLWAMNFAGSSTLVYGFNKIGAGAGAISSHSVQQLRGNVYWMGATNFYGYSSSGVAVIPCSVWDFVFQNINRDFVQNVRAMPNTPFNEVGWLFPSSASSSGECDSYVKFNITEQNGPWDFGQLSRSAAIDQTVLGMPIMAAPGGVIYQHETTNDADGSPLMASFETGFFMIADGEDFAFVDQIIPDFRWGTYAGAESAQIQFTFNVVNSPGETPISYGPYTVDVNTKYIAVRFRGRQMSITVASSDIGSFWRLGRVRYRWAPCGRDN